MPSIVRNDDVDHRLLEIVLPSQALAAAPIANQDYPEDTAYLRLPFGDN
jgi:hypothetical protein